LNIQSLDSSSPVLFCLFSLLLFLLLGLYVLHLLVFLGLFVLRLLLGLTLQGLFELLL